MVSFVPIVTSELRMSNFKNNNDPTGTRIPIAAVKGQCPNRLDDRAEYW
jgi:hypothetical protein